MNNRSEKQIRSHTSQFATRDVDGEMYIEGYFAVFNDTYEVWDGATESIATTAFDGALADDIRALINHDTTLVLGRNKAHTLELKVDERGLWGRITINRNDSDAVNLYERVKRGDVDQCSVGFDILEEDTEFLENGGVHWTIKRVKLYEVSCCTFPAYESTSISARGIQIEEIRARQNKAWKESMLKKLKGE